MVVSGNEAITGQGGAVLNFKAETGDTVRFSMASEYDNLENPVLIYGIQRFGGDNVFSKFVSRTITTKTPEPKDGDPLPPTFVDRKFWYYSADVENTGTENYQVLFAMYKRQREAPPVLVGYFRWDPTITVKE